MEFKDFENDYSQLLNKKVVYEHGMSYNKNRNQKISIITKVCKNGFRIDGDTSMLFDFSGYQKGLTGKMNMGTISRCKLLSDAEAEILKLEWKLKKEKIKLFDEILTKLNHIKCNCKITELSIGQLKQINEILEGGNK